jgi:protein-S-isoprenylcysteine O-methyltransferase Ste14
VTSGSGGSSIGEGSTTSTRKPSGSDSGGVARVRREGTGRLQRLVGVGDRIGMATLPFLLVGMALNVAFPSVFSVGGPWAALRTASISILVVGVVVWAWSVALILAKVPRGELITSGPYRLVKHPLYVGVALLVLPWVGFLCDSWLGAVIGILVYAAARTFAPVEEEDLAQRFGPAWEAYERSVAVPWL